MKKYILMLFAGITLTIQPLFAQEVIYPTKKSYEYNGQWYIGKDGGIPFGVSTFSSFGSRKHKLGWSAGMYGGYFFNTAFGVEAYMLTGRLKQTSQSRYNQFWLGSNGDCYFHQPSDIQSWKYSNLKTSVKIQIYGVRGNIDVLGLFNATKGSRWNIGILPQIALVGTKATLRTIDTNTKVMKHSTDWHFGVGGNLSFGFKITPHWSLSLYSGITYLTGKSIDSTPSFSNRDNYIWENGLRINYTFRRHPKLVKMAKRYVREAEELLHITPVETVKVVEVMSDGTEKTVEAIELPPINFPANSVMIEHSQAHKMNRIIRELKRNPQNKIIITGYADDANSKERNILKAKQRANAVKRQLIAAAINEDLILSASAMEGDVEQKGNCVIVEIIP